MKIGELREKLSKLKREEIIKLAAEFYKLVPKAKKEDYDLDALINQPNEKKKKHNSKAQLGLLEIESDINKFIENAREQYYLVPNRIVPKKERSTWRFKVKRWYKELINTKREDSDLDKQSKLLSDLYELICESCGYRYFSAYDSFESIQIEQIAFYKSVITLLQVSKGKAASLEESIKLIVDNHLNRYTLYTDLMLELLTTLDIPDLKNLGLEKTKKLIQENNFIPKKDSKNSMWLFSNGEYEKKSKNNNLATLGFKLHLSLFEIENGIHFFDKYYYEEDEEIKLYVLVRLLFVERKKEQIKIEIQKAIKKGISPRERLLDLLEDIKQNDKLPQYL